MKKPKHTRINNAPLSPLWLCAMVFFLTACGGAPKTPPVTVAPPPENAARQAVIDAVQKARAEAEQKEAEEKKEQESGEITAATPEEILIAPDADEDTVEGQLQLAAFTHRPERDIHLLNAAQMLLDQGQMEAAETVLDVLDLVDLRHEQNARKVYLRARTFIPKRYYTRALNDLGQALREGLLSNGLLADLYQLRSELHLLRNQPLTAALNLMRRDSVLESEAQVLANQHNLWRVLLSIDATTLEDALSRHAGPLEGGWINLALIYLDHAADRHILNNTLGAWLTANPAHPSARLVREALLDRPTAQPRRIALVLPLASRFGQAARAFHDGFLAMHEANSAPDKPEVRVYDYGADAELAGTYYDLAASEQADVIVGPLGRAAVAAISSGGGVRLSRPTILLGSADIALPSRVLQLALDPAEEARAAARRAFADGHRRAAVLFPATPHGRRLGDAFVLAFQELGGAIADLRSFKNRGGDYSRLIRGLLHLDQSHGRMRRLAATLGEKNFKFAARRRRDIDCIFLAADYANGRIIKPQINFHRGHDVPVYATAEIYAGKPDPALDADLNGVRFGDMPWMTQNAGLVAGLRARLQKNFAGRYTLLDRLYALGVDSYRLVFRIGGAWPAQWPGVSADLSLREDGRVMRTLNWRQFSRGLAVGVGGP